MDRLLISDPPAVGVVRLIDASSSSSHVDIAFQCINGTAPYQMDATATDDITPAIILNTSSSAFLVRLPGSATPVGPAVITVWCTDTLNVNASTSFSYSLICPIGSYADDHSSNRDDRTCEYCSAGRYGSSIGLNTSACSGECAAGRIGIGTGADVNSSCTAPCPSNHWFTTPVSGACVSHTHSFRHSLTPHVLWMLTGVLVGRHPSQQSTAPILAAARLAAAAELNACASHQTTLDHLAGRAFRKVTPGLLSLITHTICSSSLSLWRRMHRAAVCCEWMRQQWHLRTPVSNRICL